MKTLMPLTAATFTLVAVCVFAGGNPTSEEPKKPTLVEVARATKASNAGKKTKVKITDKNLQRAAKPKQDAKPLQPSADGTVVQETLVIAAEPEPVLIEQLNLALAQVANLEKEMLRLEQAYYDEADPNVRESVVRKRFDETKRQLEHARTKLSALRSAEVDASIAEESPAQKPR